jgi:hypothetical protein
MVIFQVGSYSRSMESGEDEMHQRSNTPVFHNPAGRPENHTQFLPVSMGWVTLKYTVINNNCNINSCHIDISSPLEARTIVDILELAIFCSQHN